MRIRLSLLWCREVGFELLRCDGCHQTIDITMQYHVWSDEDDEVTANYHVDCCTGKHVSEHECEDESL